MGMSVEIGGALTLGQSPARTNLATSGQAGHLARLVWALRAEIAARRAMRQLCRMSELDLHDIGLTRGDAERVVRHGRF